MGEFGGHIPSEDGQKAPAFETGKIFSCIGRNCSALNEAYRLKCIESDTGDARECQRLRSYQKVCMVKCVTPSKFDALRECFLSKSDDRRQPFAESMCPQQFAHARSDIVSFFDFIVNRKSLEAMSVYQEKMSTITSQCREKIAQYDECIKAKGPNACAQEGQEAEYCMIEKRVGSTKEWALYDACRKENRQCTQEWKDLQRKMGEMDSELLQCMHVRLSAVDGNMQFIRAGIAVALDSIANWKDNK